MKKKMLMFLFACIFAAGILPAVTFAADTDAAPAVYISADGDDAAGDGTKDKPYATLSRAVTEAPDGATIYVMSDLTVTRCARYYDKALTIASGEGGPFTITRGSDFECQQDPARSTYNPAMIEVGGQTNDKPSAFLRLENIILDDAGLREGSRFLQAESDGDGNTVDTKGNVLSNTDIVPDAMVATYNGVADICLGDGAVLRNFGGMSAVRVSGGTLTMESGSLIEDTIAADRVKNKADYGAAGAVWSQGGAVTMEEGSKICGAVGRAIYMDGGTADISGVISQIKEDVSMWWGNSGVAVHVRNGASVVLTSTGRILDLPNDGFAVDIINDGSQFTMDGGSVLRGGKNGVNITSGSLYMNGEITGYTRGGHVVQMSGEGNKYCKIGASGYIHGNTCWYGAIYIQAPDGVLDIYGKINDNTNSDRGGAIAMANNFAGHLVTMYDGAEIIGNHSDQTGGGIMVSCGTFVMNGGTISCNTAGMEGGGVFVRRGGIFIMNGGRITDNVSAAYGGGIAYEAQPYHGLDPRVELLGGTVSDNTAKNASNDIAVSASYFSQSERCLLIADGASVGDWGVYFAADAKTVTPAAGSFDIKLGNAAGSSIEAINNAADAKGWGGVLASFWMQRHGAAKLIVKGLQNVNASLPVYAAVLETDEQGMPAEDAECAFYSTAVTDDGIVLAVPGDFTYGCAVALIQPTDFYGLLTLTAPATITEAEGAENYEIVYTAVFTPSQNLLSLIDAGETLSGLTVTLVPDKKLTERVTEIEITLSELTSQFTATLPADCLTADGVLYTSGNVRASLGGRSVYIPGNIVETDMIVLNRYTVKFDANGGVLDEGTATLVTVVEGDMVSQPVAPSRKGYDFSGWYSDGAAYDFASPITGDITLTAQWKQHRNPPIIPKTGSVVLTKTDLSDTSTVLSGVIFELYKTGASKIGTYITDQQGTIRVNKLAAGAYYFVETRAAEGYVLDTALHPFTVRNGQTVRLTVTNQKSDVPSLFADEHRAYIVGYPDGLIRPEANITRAEVATIFFRLLSDEARQRYMTEENSFADVPKAAWYNTAVSTMAALGAVRGYDGRYYPNNAITRAEFAAIAARFDSNSEFSGSAFTDIYGHWAQKEISAAANNGWILGYEDGTFRPERRITRAEAMAMVNRVLQRIPETADDLLDGMILWPDNADSVAWYYLAVQEATNSHAYIRKGNGYESWVKH